MQDMRLISQLYSGIYPPMVPEQGASKPRRSRRRKNKGATGLTGTKKRKLSPEQVNLLELNFGNEHKLESERKDKLALELGLDPRQVAVWFQNRRARFKYKKLEEEYSKLKAAHVTAAVEKSRLESEILKLKEELGEAKKEIQQLSELVDGFSSNNSPSPSVLSMEANIDPQFFGEFGMENYDNVFNLPETNYIFGMEWMHNM